MKYRTPPFVTPFAILSLIIILGASNVFENKVTHTREGAPVRQTRVVNPNQNRGVTSRNPNVNKPNNDKDSPEKGSSNDRPDSSNSSSDNDRADQSKAKSTESDQNSSNGSNHVQKTTGNSVNKSGGSQSKR